MSSENEHNESLWAKTQLGVTVAPELLAQALTHRSVAHESRRGRGHNERLEFLGDSILGMLVAEHLYQSLPEAPEGELAKLRSSLVSRAALARVARELGVGEQVRLGVGEAASGGGDKESILADTLEALIGAVYLTGGIDAGRKMITNCILGQLQEPEQLERDWKSVLQERAAAAGLGSVIYQVSESGPDHEKIFLAQVHLNGSAVGEPGEGRSKKDAEKSAAENALEMLSPES